MELTHWLASETWNAHLSTPARFLCHVHRDDLSDPWRSPVSAHAPCCSARAEAMTQMSDRPAESERDKQHEKRLRKDPSVETARAFFV